MFGKHGKKIAVFDGFSLKKPFSNAERSEITNVSNENGEKCS